MSKTFSVLGIHAELQENLAKLQISVPTDVQEKTMAWFWTRHIRL